MKVILVGLTGSQFEMVSKVCEVPDSYGYQIRVAFFKPFDWVIHKDGTPFKEFAEPINAVELIFTYKGDRQGVKDDVLIYKLTDIKGIQ